MSYSHPYRDQETGTYYVDKIAYVNMYRKKKQLEYRKRVAHQQLTDMALSFESLRSKANSMDDVIAWIMDNRLSLAFGVVLLNNSSAEGSAEQPYWHKLSLLGVDDGLTPSSDNPFSCFHIGTKSEPGFRLFQVMLHIGAEHFANGGNDNVPAEFSGSYSVTLFAKDWSFVAARHLFDLVQREKGIKPKYSGYTNMASVEDLDFYHRPRKKIIEQHLTTHFPEMNIDEFSQFEHADLFPDNVDEFISLMNTYKAPVNVNHEVVLPLTDLS